MIRAIEIDEFVASLAGADITESRSTNIYQNEVRCNNLRRWLNTFDPSSRTALFIGEAPGKYGGAITGIPFVSPNVITASTDHWGAFRPSLGYKIPEGEDVTQRERTATRFWKHVPDHLVGLPRPLTWNIYPFWPFEVTDGGETLNRAPTNEDIKYGSPWLRQIVEMHPKSYVVAVGIKAFETLRSMGICASLMPHPSRGSDAKLIRSIGEVARMLRG